MLGSSAFRDPQVFVDSTADPLVYEKNLIALGIPYNSRRAGFITLCSGLYNLPHKKDIPLLRWIFPVTVCITKTSNASQGNDTLSTLYQTQSSLPTYIKNVFVMRLQIEAFIALSEYYLSSVNVDIAFLINPLDASLTHTE